MAAETKKEIELEIAHVLFLDIVGYSKLSVNEQHAGIEELNEIVRLSEQFRKAEAANRILKIPTGDGMALVFYKSPEEPAQCAFEISRALKDNERLQIRMGIHSGPVSGITDVNDRSNVAGAGINLAQRVMDCGDAGHILLSKHLAEDLEHYARWRPLLHELGECETKHGAVISVVNLYGDEVGNPQLPEKFKEAQQERAAKALAKSIAVLPFENLSRDPDNAYFAQGIQEEILTRMASIADLRVISRTSTQQYQIKPRNLSKIAKQLGVANILEGSVQKAADQVRVSVQLINARSDSHIWAETYDRKLTDIFGVESEIAKSIAQSLQAKLTGREEQSLATRPTNNPQAYEAYLRGIAFEARSDFSCDLAKKAIGFFERAVELDPNFAFAWARLSRAHAFFYIRFYDMSAVRHDAAKRALDHAQRLQLNSLETQFALGYYQYWLLHDYKLAKTTFGLLGKLLPGNSEIPLALGSLARRQGNWDESIAYLERGLALDPHNYELLKTTALSYTTLRQYPSALILYDRALDIAPNDLEVMAAKANIYQAQGNLKESAKLLVQVNEQTDAALASRIKIIQLRLERNYGDAIQLLQTRLTQFHFDSEIDRSREQVALALFQRLAGDNAGATFTAGQVRSMLELLRKTQPESALVAGLLCLANAALGEKGSALKEVERALALPSAKEPIFRAAGDEVQLLIQTMFGENSSAMSTLSRLLRTPYLSLLYGTTPVTPVLLGLDPYWDSLRSDPAFQKLCEEKQP